MRYYRLFSKALLLGWAIVLGVTAHAQAGAPPVRLRGTLESIEATRLVVKTRDGELVALDFPASTPIAEVVPISLADIQQGSFIGTAAMPKADGQLAALEVVVFPEAARGTGEGHYPWDLKPGSTMTNANVAQLVQAPNGRTLKLQYKGGEQTVTVADNVPVVTFKPSDRSLLVVGSKVLVTAQERDGKPTALRVLAGRNGVAPPM